MRDNAVCQAFVPSTINPGDGVFIEIGFVKQMFFGTVLIGYYVSSNNSYHIEHIGSNRQNFAFMRSCWHRFDTDRLKRTAGIKLNLKPLPTNCVVQVSYRTVRDGAFSSPVNITASNQDEPILFPSAPRSREIQFRFKYDNSSNATATPELLSYAPLYEVLNTMR